MSHRFGARGFRRILGLRPALSGRFGLCFLCRGLVNVTPFLIDLAGPVATFCMRSAPISLRCWRRCLWPRLELF